MALPPMSVRSVGHTGLGGLRRTLKVDAALVKPEWRVPVGHQRHINQQPVAPPIDSKCQVNQADNAS
jgi:hypothetical protein